MEYFELLVSAYRPDAGGKLLVKWFREDWGLFDHPRMDDPRAKELLSEILDDGEIVRRTFAPARNFDADRLGDWEKLRGELMYNNRFFPEVVGPYRFPGDPVKQQIDLKRLEDLLSRLILEDDEIPPTWYRARMQVCERPFAGGDMGAPPNRIASHGRANPAGIPYLYLGSTQHTAISEIRPHTGEIACVADFATPAGLKLVDLRSPRKMVSPFLLEDAEAIGRMRSDLPFLDRLGAELTRPVVPQSAAIDYAPSQYLCEFIKRCGYDGVIYRSSVSQGINLALFNPARATHGQVLQYRISRVLVDIEQFAVDHSNGAVEPD